MAYCKYLRKSRADLEAESRGEGETLARHSRILDELAVRMGLEVIGEYREIVTGESIEARPQMQQLLKDVNAGMWEGVLVVEIERLARGDTIDQGTVAKAFKYSETKIITPMKTYNPSNEFDEEYFEFGLFMSRREYQTIRRRLQAGRLAATKEGKYVGSIPPYGYRRIRLEHDSGYTLEPIPEESEVVQYIFRAYAGISMPAQSFCEIVRHLNQIGSHPARRDIWTYESLSCILHNPVYIGKVKWNFRPEVKRIENGKVKKSRPRLKLEEMILADGLHPAIITQEEWDAVQQKLKENIAKYLPQKRELKNPLAGILVCGKCGHVMSRQANSDPNKTMLICSNLSCNNVGAYLSEIEISVLQAVEHWMKNYQSKLDDQAERHSSSFASASCQSLLNRKQKDLETLYSQRDRLHDLLEQGIYTPEVFRQRMESLVQRITDIQAAVSELQEELTEAIKREEALGKIIPTIQDTLQLYRSANSAQEKNDLLHIILERVEYTKDARGQRGKKEKFHLTIFPKMPK